MSIKIKRLALAIVGVSMLTIYGCGGGSGGGGGTGTAATPPTILTGVAATGAAFTDATVVVDSRGVVVGTLSPTAEVSLSAPVP